MGSVDFYAVLAGRLGENASAEILRRMFTPGEARVLALAGTGHLPETAPETHLMVELYHSGYLEREGAGYALSSWRDVLYQYLLSARYARQPGAEREVFRRHFLERNLRRFREVQTAPFRVLPAEGTLAHLDHHVVVPYTVAAEVLAAAGSVVVIDCVCRVAMGECERPRNVCLSLGDATAYYRERGLGRSLDQRQAQHLLARAADDGLVHCMDNPAMRQPARVICNCCECCCVFVRGLKQYGLPRTIASAGYLAVTDADVCNGCGVCVKRCIFDARELTGEGIALDIDKCLGCGQCVRVCPTGAVTLEVPSGPA